MDVLSDLICIWLMIPHITFTSCLHLCESKVQKFLTVESNLGDSAKNIITETETWNRYGFVHVKKKYEAWKVKSCFPVFPLCVNCCCQSTAPSLAARSRWPYVAEAHQRLHPKHSYTHSQFPYQCELFDPWRRWIRGDGLGQKGGKQICIKKSKT